MQIICEFPFSAYCEGKAVSRKWKEKPLAFCWRSRACDHWSYSHCHFHAVNF
jgi:hypothetical protein